MHLGNLLKMPVKGGYVTVSDHKFFFRPVFIPLFARLKGFCICI